MIFNRIKTIFIHKFITVFSIVTIYRKTQYKITLTMIIDSNCSNFQRNLSSIVMIMIRSKRHQLFASFYNFQIKVKRDRRCCALDNLFYFALFRESFVVLALN